MQSYVGEMKRFCAALGTVMGTLLKSQKDFLNGEFSVQLAVYVSACYIVNVLRANVMTLAWEWIPLRAPSRFFTWSTLRKKTNVYPVP